MAKLELDAQKLTEQIYIEVKIKRLRQWRWRLRVVSWLFRICWGLAWLGGIEFIEFDMDELNDDILDHKPEYKEPEWHMQ